MNNEDMSVMLCVYVAASITALSRDLAAFPKHLLRDCMQ